MTTGIDSRVERLASMSRAVLDRLDRGERLSVVLAQSRKDAELYGNRAHVHWLDCEIYGLVDVPFAKQPRNDDDDKAGVYLFCQLRRAADVRKITVDGVLRDWSRDKTPPDRSLVVHHSVGHLERSAEEHRPPTRTDPWAPASDRDLQLDLLHSEHQRVLDGVRAYVYQYMSSIWSWAIQERENLALLGRDYHVVVDSLEALQTGVGEELLAALGNLRTDNPANWALAALACRNVVLKLGRTLFVSDQETYESELAQRTLKLGGEMEKNKLCAFIDRHFRSTAGSVKSELKRLDQLARSIYERGSKGKSATRHAEAQQLVIDTFDLVGGLERLTGLHPVTYP